MESARKQVEQLDEAQRDILRQWQKGVDLSKWQLRERDSLSRGPVGFDSPTARGGLRTEEHKDAVKNP